MTMAGAPQNRLSAAPSGKSPGAFRTISEVARELELPQHVLRFWETKFSQIQPMKRGGGRRYYRPEDVNLLRRIRDLLYRDGYTIKGVQRLLRQNGAKNLLVQSPAPESAEPEIGKALGASQRAELKALLAELEDLRDLLRKS